MSPPPTSTESTLFPPLDVNRLGVPQPSLATKDILIIIFMFLLWAYSLYLTYRAWYKLLYSDGEERGNMWRFFKNKPISPLQVIPIKRDREGRDLTN